MGTAYLILENGTVFKGRSFGHDGEAIGELVFTTGATGYLETLSDPAYYGQIVLQTFPLIGNYGAIAEDFGDGSVHPSAYIAREWCQEPSNFRSEGNLDSFLREHKTPGLSGIDTRALTRIIREEGTMNAMLSKTPELSGEQWSALRGYKVTGAVAEVMNRETGSESYRNITGVPGWSQNARFLLWDFGGSQMLFSLLTDSRCVSAVASHGVSALDILAHSPDGVVILGGPGDPAENAGAIEQIARLCRHGVPIWGVGLGHQMLALARGASTEKLRFGHRGANQPVRDLKTGRVFVTAQNHGYAVSKGTLPQGAAMRYESLNDGTCEGIDYADIPAFSVQFEPTGEFVERFIAMTKEAPKCR